MEAGMGNSIRDCFSGLTEPRDSNKRHQLIDIITVVLCAVICNADTWEEIEEFGHAKYEWFKTFLELPHGVPSPDTFARVFASLEPMEFREAFLRWVEAIKTAVKGHIAIDGKTVRHSYGNETSPIHMVSAWASENRMVLGQVKTDEKSNEITAIPELLQVLALEGCIVTIDAMGCQKTIAGKIIDKGADYVLGLKGNQGTLHDATIDYIHEQTQTDFRGIGARRWDTAEQRHGRIERRTYIQMPAPKSLPGFAHWKGLLSIGLAFLHCLRDGKEATEVRYFISSLPVKVKRFAHAVRSHWGIENSCHWCLDVTYREDESRIRDEHLRENFAWLNRLTLSLLKQHPEKDSVAMKRRACGWNDDYMLQVLTGTGC
jgi:predicted transposase YbfD/YdcC